jgi:hypothetical protein
MHEFVRGVKSRRRFIQEAAAATAGGAWLAEAASFAAAVPARRPKVAAIFTEFRYRSHAFNILENFFEPYYFNGELVDPGCEVVAFYADQFPDKDLARDVSQRLNIPLYGTIDEALCCGGKELAVDAALVIGEHGAYPYNDLGQHLYPRKQFFDQAVAVMRRSGRFIPYFNDKHLSYRWDWAKEMYDTARRHGMPLMAGSSVPLAQRLPAVELPPGCELEGAVAVHGGDMESYGFHGLEVLQSFVESRRGGETGIARVETLVGEEAERAADAGRWSRPLRDAALAAEVAHDQRRQDVFGRTPPRHPPPAFTMQDHVILVTYRDGFQAAVVGQRGPIGSSRWSFACRLKGESEPRAAMLYNSPWGNRGLFKALSHAIQHLFVVGKEPYPIERTLLTGGAIEAAMQSFGAKRPIDTPHLNIAYTPTDFKAFRELGGSWRKITVDTPQPTDFVPGDARLKTS